MHEEYSWLRDAARRISLGSCLRPMEFDDEVVEAALASGSSQASEKQRTISEFILSRNDEIVLEALERRCRDVNSGEAVLNYARALFRFLMPLVEKDESSRPAKLLVLVVVRVIELMNEQKLDADKKVLECLSFFAQEMSSLPCRLLPSVWKRLCPTSRLMGPMMKAGAWIFSLTVCQ